MNIMNIRLEQEKDYREVEILTREAFWNLYVPGCNEHYLVHILRDNPNAVRELNFVAEKDGKLVGNIVYTKNKVIENEQTHEVLSFGPLSVLPEYQNQGIGKALIEHSSMVAKELGYRAIIIYGYPGYYHKRGFVSASKYKISRSDGKFAPALMAIELYENALDGVEGRFFEDESFDMNQALVDDFDKGFEAKEKFETESQKEFIIASSMVE